MTSIQCPGCRTSLTPTGDVTLGGRVLSVYQCDTCTRPWEFDGQVFDVALTFALDEDGNLLDPETGQRLPPPPSPN